MKKRIVSAFSLACMTVLLLDYSINQQQSMTEFSVKNDSDIIAGVMSSASVDMKSLSDLSMVDSDTTITAASLGAMYGYKNIGICTVESGNLNIRESASTDGKIVGKFPKNAACEVLSTEGEWSLIQSGKIKGYVLSEYLCTGDDAWNMAVDLAQYVATAKTGGLNVRSEASTESEILAQLCDGEEVTVLDDSDAEWVKVDLDGEEGFVFKEYIDIDLSLNTAMTLAEARYGAEVSEVRVSLCDCALQYVGNPYVWGGTSLEHGADCSGFVMQIYAKYGVSLPHSSRAQANCGKTISYGELKPGDLIFYGKGKYISHVAIYIGGGQICHASSKRTGIKVSNASYRNPIKCVRILSE